MKRTLVLLLTLVIYGCVTVPAIDCYKEYFYNFVKDKLTVASPGSEMMTWGERGVMPDDNSTIGEIKAYKFSRALIYSGVEDNTLRLSYREYANDYARPAFTQELTYNLKTDSTICFKDNRIGIISADNRGITFIVFASPMFAYKSGQRIDLYPASTDTSTDIFRPGSGRKYNGK